MCELEVVGHLDVLEVVAAPFGEGVRVETSSDGRGQSPVLSPGYTCKFSQVECRHHTA